MKIQTAYSIKCKNGSSAFVPSIELLQTNFNETDILTKTEVLLLVADEGKVLQSKNDESFMITSIMLLNGDSADNYIEIDAPVIEEEIDSEHKEDDNDTTISDIQ